MNWSRIKTVLILLLLAANAYLIYAIVSQYRVSTRIDPGEIEAAAALLAKDGFTVRENALSGRRIELKVWRSAFPREKEDGSGHEFVIRRLFGSPEYSQSLTVSGVEVSAEGIGTLSFSDSDPLYIKFVAAGCDYDGSADEAAADPESDRQVGKLRKLNLANILKQFLAGGDTSSLTADERRADIDVDMAIYERDSRRYVAHFIQKIDGCPIEGTGGIFAVRNDTVEYFRGSAVLMSGAAGYNAELLDEINILFLEKDSVLSVASPSEAEITSGGEYSPAAAAMTVTETSPLYCVIWNSDRTEYYLIPSWKISYSDGTSSVRNAVNGNIVAR